MTLEISALNFSNLAVNSEGLDVKDRKCMKLIALVKPTNVASLGFPTCMSYISGLPVALTLTRMSDYGSREGHSKPRKPEVSWFRVSLARSVIAYSHEGEGHLVPADYS